MDVGIICVLFVCIRYPSLSCGLHLLKLSMHARASFQNVDLSRYMPMMPRMRMSHPPPFDPQLPDYAVRSRILRRFKSNRLEPPSISAHQASRHPSHDFIQNLTTASSCSPKPRLFHHPYTQFLI